MVLGDSATTREGATFIDRNSFDLFSNMCDQCNLINCACCDSDFVVINLDNNSSHFMKEMHSPYHFMSEERERILTQV